MAKKGWSKQCYMIVGNNDNIQSFQKVFDEACTYTVAFGAASRPGVLLQADIIWSVAGNSVTRTVSVADGVSVTAVAEGVRVILRDVTGTVLAPGPQPGDKYYIGMQVAPGSRPSVEKPPTLVPTVSAAVVAGGSSVAIDLPESAGVISILIGIVGQPGTPILTGDIQVKMFQNLSGGLIQAYDPLLAPGFIPVPPGCTRVEIDNNTASNGMRFSWTFGIDG